MPTRRIDNDPDSPCWDTNNCRHPEHNSPNMLYIPAGQVWEHTCPACGKRTIMRGTNITY